MKSDLLELLVDAQRLNKALTDNNDFNILVKNRHTIKSLTDFSDWLREIYESREIKEFKKVLKYLDGERKFLSKKGSPKASVIESYIKSLKMAYLKLLATFKFLLDEIHRYEDNIARNVLIQENCILRNLLSSLNIHFNEVNISENTSRFIMNNRKDFNKIDKKSINDVEIWLEEYKEAKKTYPKDIEELKKFVKK